MAAPLQLQIQGDASNFTFAIDGEFLPRREVIFEDASVDTTNYQPDPIEIRDVWEIRGAKIQAADVAATWTAFNAFMDRLKTSGSSRATSFPSWARIVRDPSGSATVVWTLGATGYTNFRIEEVRAEDNGIKRGEEWITQATLSLRISAAIRNADVNGIVGFAQEIEVSYPNGLRTLAWRTRVTTKEGVSAVTKAQTFATIPIASLGGDHSFITNGPDGIDYRVLDAKAVTTGSPADRVPTAVDAVSTIQQWGTATGVTAGQGSPSTYEDTTILRVTPELEETITIAGAQGPNASTFVRSKRPISFLESEEITERAINRARGTWTSRRNRYNDPSVTVRIELGGGHQVIAFEPVGNGFDPVRFDGGRLAWVAVVTITVQKRGAFVPADELQFPGALPEPWVFMAHESIETSPERVEIAPLGRSRADDLWRREARLVFRSASRPGKLTQLFESIRDAKPVDTHLGVA